MSNFTFDEKACILTCLKSRIELCGSQALKCREYGDLTNFSYWLAERNEARAIYQKVQDEL